MQVPALPSSYHFTVLSGIAREFGRGFSALAQELQQEAQKKREEEEALRAVEQAKIKKQFDEANAKLKGAGKHFKKAYDSLVDSTSAAVKGIKEKANVLQKRAKNGVQTLQKSVTDTVKHASKAVPEIISETKKKTEKASSLINTVIEIGREFRKISGLIHLLANSICLWYN